MYLITEPVDQARLRPLVRILISMIFRVLASKLEFEGGQPKPTYRHRLLLLLDEFISLGRLDVLQQSLATCSGHGLKAYLVCQDIAQLRAVYGKEETITSNSHVQIAFAPNRVETGECLSRLAGTATIVKEQVTKNGRGLSTNVSRSMQEVQRPLLTADECMRLPGPRKDVQGRIKEPGDMLICAAGHPVCYGKQPLYFQDPTFKVRADVPPPEQGNPVAALK